MMRKLETRLMRTLVVVTPYPRRLNCGISPSNSLNSLNSLPGGTVATVSFPLAFLLCILLARTWRVLHVYVTVCITCKALVGIGLLVSATDACH